MRSNSAVLLAVALGLLTLSATTTTPAPAAKPKSKPAAKAPAKTPAKVVVQPVAPENVPHPIALFLAGLCREGKKSVTLKASAVGTRFFIEEPVGVTVYVYDGTGYTREAFLRGEKLDRAVKKYARLAGTT